MSYWLCSATSSLNTKMERVGGRSTQGCLRFFLKIFRGLLRGNSAAPQRSCLKKHTLNSTLYVPTWESAIPARQQRKSSLICDWVRNNYLGLGLQRDVSAANIIHGSLTCYLSALSRWAFTVWCEHRHLKLNVSATNHIKRITTEMSSQMIVYRLQVTLLCLRV